MKVLFPTLVYQYFKTLSSIDFYLWHFLLHLFLFRFDILILLRAVIKYLFTSGGMCDYHKMHKEDREA